MTDSTLQYAKVLFRVPNNDGTAEVETLWAIELGDDNYKLDNLPFFAYGVSLDDVIFAPFAPDEGFPTFRHVVSKSGHRTVRVIFDPPIEDGNASDRLLQGLVAIGCTYEGANTSYMSIDIPPTIDLEDVRNYLVDRGANWEYADPTYDDLFPEDA